MGKFGTFRTYNSNFRVAGEQAKKGDDSGNLVDKATFNKKNEIEMIDNYKRSNINISQRLYIIYEGKIISYFVFGGKAK